MRPDLYSLVEQYFALGNHRTGGEADAATISWISDLLAAKGLSVRHEPVPYQAWLGMSTLTVDGSPVDHLAVPYEFDGSINSDTAPVVEFDPVYGGFPTLLDDAIAAASRDHPGKPAVLATTHRYGALVAVNRLIGPGSQTPTFLVGTADLDRLRNGEIRAQLRAERAAAVATNVVARNDVDGQPVLITTPLNGWFGCAGERGTGIAVLVDLVDRLADIPLVVVASTGHELGHFGIDEWVRNATWKPRGTIHIGASVAALDVLPDGTRWLARTRSARTSVGPDAGTPMAQALFPAYQGLEFEALNWLGEATSLDRLGSPLLSFSGAAADFHTPQDTPERATSPQSLGIVADAVVSTVRCFVEAID